MKTLTNLFIILFALNLNAQFSVVDSPAYYYITVDNDTIPERFTKESKAILKAAEVSASNKGKSVQLLRPIANFTFDGDFNAEVDLTDVYAQIDTLKMANEFQGIVITSLQKEILTLEDKITYIDSVNRKKYEILKASNDRLRNRVNDLYFKLDNNYIIADSAYVVRGGWEIGEGTYTYNPFPDNMGYLVLDTWQLELGSTYKLSFDVISENQAWFDIWIFEDPNSPLSPDWTNGRVSDIEFAPTGLYEFTYTVTIMNRRKVSLRARNEGGIFTISNLKLEKL
jgi:hypothetical protein